MKNLTTMKKQTFITGILFLITLYLYGQDTIGTVLVKDIKSFEGYNYNDYNSSFPQGFIAVDGNLYFSANYKNELWKTDGTSLGTQLVKTFGSSSGYVDYLTPFGNSLLFSAYDGICCSQPWISDGTTAGTRLFSTSNPTNPNNFFVYNNKVFFSANYNNTSQLWVSDGTNSGTTVLTRTGTGDRNPYGFFPFKNKLFFACQSNMYTAKLWVTDGTVDSTYELAISGSLFDKSISFFKPCIYKDMMYYSSSTAINGNELWRTDGTTNGTALFKDINIVQGKNSNPRNFTVCNSNLYFVASDDSTNNTNKLFYTDGDSLYTVKYNKDIYTFNDVFVINNKLFAEIQVKYNDPFLLCEVNDKTDSLVPFLSSDSTLLYSITRLTTWNNQLLFQKSNTGNTLWTTDGTIQNTHLLFPDSIIRKTATMNSSSLFEWNNELYYAGFQNDSIGTELYKITTDRKILEQQTGSAIVSKYKTSLFPNPCKSKILINFNGIREKRHIKVFSLLGNVVYDSVSSDSDVSIDLQQLPNGIYLVSIESNSKFESYKIIKQ